MLVSVSIVNSMETKVTWEEGHVSEELPLSSGLVTMSGRNSDIGDRQCIQASQDCVKICVKG